MTATSEKTNAFLIHISALLGFIFPFGSILFPLLLWKAQKRTSNFLETNGTEAVNFNISFGFYRFTLITGLVISFFLVVLKHNTFGIFTLIGIYALFELMHSCLIILAAIKAQKGEKYEYPMTIKFLKQNPF